MDIDKYVKASRYKINKKGQPALVEALEGNFAYSEYESVRDFVQRFIQENNIDRSFYIWSNRYNIGICNFTDNLAIKLRIDPYHPENIGEIQSLNIMYEEDSTEAIRENPALLFNYKVKIHNWRGPDVTDPVIEYDFIDRFDTVMSIYQKISDLFKKPNQTPYIWTSDADGKEVAPFGFGLEKPRWTGYHINPWKATAPANLKDYDPIPHVHYHRTDAPQGYIQYDLNVVFPDYFIGRDNEFFVFNPHYFQYFPICSTPIMPLALPVFVTRKNKTVAVEGIYPDDKYLTVMYKIAAAFKKNSLPFLYSGAGTPIGISTKTAHMTVKGDLKKSLYARLSKEYATFTLAPDEIPDSAPTIEILNRNFKFTQRLDALFPDDFKEKNVNFLKHFFPEEYKLGFKTNDKKIHELIYKKSIKDHTEMVFGVCNYNLLEYQGHIPALARGDMTFADIFDTVPTSLEISMIQWIDDRGRVLYKLFKKHKIPEHIFEKWTDKDENIKKRHGEDDSKRNYCVNLYGMLDEGYYVVSFRESGNFIITYNIGKRDYISYMSIYEHQKWLITRLNQHLSSKLKAYLVNIEVTTELNLTDPDLTIDMIITRFNEYSNIVFKEGSLRKISADKIYGEFLRADNVGLERSMNFELKIEEGILISVFISHAPSMPDVRRSMHYIRSILLLNPITADEKKKGVAPVEIAEEAAEAEEAPSTSTGELPELEEAEAEDWFDKFATETGMAGGGDGLVISKLKIFDATIFNNASSTEDETTKYSRICQKGYQPWPISDNKMKEIGTSGYVNSVRFGSDTARKYNLICPAYICEKSEVPLLKKTDKCPLGNKERKIQILDKEDFNYVYFKKRRYLKSGDNTYQIPCCGNKEEKVTSKKKTIQVSQDSFYRSVPKIITKFAPKAIDSKEVNYGNIGKDLLTDKNYFIGLDIAGENMANDPLMETIAFCSHFNNKRVLIYNIKKILTPSVFLSLENGAVFTAFSAGTTAISSAAIRGAALRWCNKDPVFMNVFKPKNDDFRIVALYDAYLKYVKYLEYNEEKSPYLLFDLMRHLGIFLTIWEYDKREKDLAEMSVRLFCPYYRSADSIAKNAKKIIMIGKNVNKYEAIVIYSRKNVKKGERKEQTNAEDLTITRTQRRQIMAEVTEKTYTVPDKLEDSNEIIYARLDLVEDLAAIIKKCPGVEGENDVESFLPKFLAQRRGPWEGILDLAYRLVYVRPAGAEGAEWASLPLPIPIGYLPDYIDPKHGLQRLYYQEEATLMPGSPTFAPITLTHRPKMMVSNRSKYLNEIFEKEKNKQLFWYRFQHTFAQWLYKNYDHEAVAKALRATSRAERVQRLFDVMAKYLQMPVKVEDINRDSKKILAHYDEIEKAAAVPGASNALGAWLESLQTDTDNKKVQMSYDNMSAEDQRRLRPLYEKAMAVFKLRAKIQNMQQIADMTEKDYKQMLLVGIEELPVKSKFSLLRWLREHQAMDRYPFFSMEVRETPREYIFSQGAIEEQVVLPIIYSKKSLNFSGDIVDHESIEVPI